MKNQILYSQYYDNTSILVININGRIRRVHTPFKVRCRNGIDQIIAGAIVYVEEVSMDAQDGLFYTIHCNKYKHHHFVLIVKF
jgi:hypothetical protein